jgi:hypothetical protein
VREYLGGGALLSDPAPGLEHDDLVAQQERLLDVVGDEHDRLPEIGLQLQQLPLQLPPDDGVDRAEGLVHEQDVRVRCERPGHAHALLLAARELAGVAAAEGRIEPDALEQARRRRARRASGRAGEDRHGDHVVDHGAVRQEAPVLHDVADRTAQLDRVALAHIAAVDEHAPRGRIDHAVHHPQQRGLSRSRRAHQHHGAVGGDDAGEVRHGPRASRVLLRHVLELDHVDVLPRAGPHRCS